MPKQTTMRIQIGLTVPITYLETLSQQGLARKPKEGAVRLIIDT